MPKTLNTHMHTCMYIYTYTYTRVSVFNKPIKFRFKNICPVVYKCHCHVMSFFHIFFLLFFSHLSFSQGRTPSRVDARLQHLVQDALERVVLERGRHALLVAELLVDLVVLGVRVLLAADDDAVVGRQGALEADAHAQADDRGQGAVRDGRRDVHRHRHDGVGRRVAEGGGRADVYVREVDDGELPEGDGMLGVGYRGNQVWSEC